jgi:hypothetical protein
MTATEFATLSSLERICETQGLIPKGASVKQIREVLHDEGFGEYEPLDVTNALMAMRRRRLVISCPGRDAARWLPTLYGRNVVTA